MPSFLLSAVRVGVQPAAELRHLKRHGHGPDVHGALLPVACSESAVEPSPARCVHRGRLPPAASWTTHLPQASCALLSTLGSTRRRSTSR
eukprot:scaffold42036_cov45-Phaeocystis_antarctica.AAC.3